MCRYSTKFKEVLSSLKVSPIYHFDMRFQFDNSLVKSLFAKEKKSSKS